MSKINVTRSSMPEFEEYCEEIKGLWDSRWLTNSGEKHREFEQNLKKYLKTPNVTLYVNGHLALENILEAYDFPKGSEIITTPFTFASTTHAIIRKGFVPVFCDINPDDYTIDAEKIEELITNKTVAILPVHVYGNICDIDKIKEISKKYNLKVIYDAAHAFGITVNGKSSANFGDASMFSFHATKVFHSIEGGMLSFSDSSLEKKLNILKNFGIEDADKILYCGGNAKMNEFAAAMGICNLRHLDKEIEKRKTAVMLYRERLENISGIKLNIEQDGVKSNYAYFPVLFYGYKYNRDEIFRKLLENGISARKYFYPLTNSAEFLNKLDCNAKLQTPVAKHISENILTLPLYADITKQEIDKICDVILK